MKIAILGNQGMLGHMVEGIFKGSRELTTVGFGRESLDLWPRNLNSLGEKLTALIGFNTDYVVNCMGAVKPTFDAATDLSIPIYVNAVFPHQLATWCELVGAKLIHISTDCVYAGECGEYDEEDYHNATDMYGKSKSLGEPTNSMVLRTSIVGPEKGGRHRSLLEWLRSKQGGEVPGYSNHLWNGLTTLELSHLLMDIIERDLYAYGVYHLYSDDITKAELLREIIQAYSWDIEVKDVEAEDTIDRRLRTSMDLRRLLAPLPLVQQLDNLATYEKNLARG